MSYHNMTETVQRQNKVLLIYTGGTIGMGRNPKTGALEPLDFQQLSMQVPEFEWIPTGIDIYQFTPPIDSSDMTPKLWAQLVQIIADRYEQYDGFVILHGTDTMAFTASALSFMLENLTKPVILTGSQLPIGQLRTDGKENLITSIEIAMQGQGATVPTMRTIQFDKPIEAYGGTVVEASLRSGSDEGTSVDWTATVTKINGNEAQAGRPGTTKLYVTYDNFIRTPLIEEFTSQRCIACPQMAYFLDKALDEYEGDYVCTPCIDKLSPDYSVFPRNRGLLFHLLRSGSHPALYPVY